MSHIQKTLTKLLVSTALVLLVAGCSQSRLPAELRLTTVAYKADDIQPMGPGGFSQSFVVYELSQDVAARISSEGLSYLNSLPAPREDSPPTKGPWWGPFSDWKMTPVPIEKAWLRHGRYQGENWKPSLRTFYLLYKGDEGKNAFLSRIPLEYVEAFQSALTAPGSFYAYGDYRGICLIVISPKMGKAFYLFRD